MQSSWTPSEGMLDRYARGHFQYEVMMVHELARRLAAGSLHDLVMHNATLEALLVHLRLLDDFFGDTKQATAPRQGRTYLDDVFARHWLPTWTPKRIMRPVERSRSHAQIAHLTARRRMKHPWAQLPQMVTRCFTTLIEFIDELEKMNPRRARAFADARAVAESFVRGPLAVHRP